MKLTKQSEEFRIVTVNWNKPNLTIKCVKSFISDHIPESNIIIVDNGSTDNSVNLLRESFPASLIIESTVNLGFAGGFNLGIKEALSHDASYVFMVNNDTEITKGMMVNLLTVSKEVHADISAPAIYYADQSNELWSAGGYFNKFLSAPIDAHRRDKHLPQEPVKREFLTGCALLINSKVFETIGFFDERFFLYYEDLDFNMRAHKAGLDLWLIPTAKLYHHVSASSENTHSDKVYYWMAHSSWLYFQKHAKVWQWIFILPWRIGHAIKTIVHIILQKKYRAIKAYLLGFLNIDHNRNEKLYSM